MDKFDVSFRKKKNSVAFEGVIITSDTEFFENLGWVKGEDMPPAIIEFFHRAYSFILSEIGYHGTDENILSAVVHVDEKTPHLQLYYLPIVDTGRKKVYEKDADGKVNRNEKGSPIQKKDKSGKAIYEIAKLDRPKLCSDDFWNERGGQFSYGSLQDNFHECIGLDYGLERGAIGSDRKHTTKYEWEKKQQEEMLKANEDALSKTMIELQEAKRAHTRLTEENAELEDKNRRLSEEAQPIEEYLSAFREAMNGNLPISSAKLKKMVVGLTVKYKELEEEKKIGDKDRAEIFSSLQNAERQIPELKKYKEFYSFLNTYAPDKLNEAKETAKQRRDAPRMATGKWSGNTK